MKKRIFALTAAVALLLALSACGGQPSPTDAPKESSASQTDSSSGVKTEDEIKADLTDSKEDFFGLFDPYCHDLDGNFETSYTIDSLTIDRRKSDLDAGTDDVYTTIVASSPTEKFTGEFHLFYSLYDVGGWYLESIEMESETHEPLDDLTDEQVLFNLTSIFYDLGADESDFTIWEKNVNGTDATISAGLDFSDGLITAKGSVHLNYYHDGISWTQNGDCYDTLAYDILADGTYKLGPDHNGLAMYFVLNHENGEVVVRIASGKPALARFNDFQIASDMVFDYPARSCSRQEDFYNITDTYRFTSEGTIDVYEDETYIGTFTKIAEPITDINKLAELET